MARARSAPVQFFWPKDDPYEVSQKLAQLSVDIGEYQAPLLASASILQKDMESRFQTGTDPHGRPWEDWSEAYREDAQGTNIVVFPDRGSLQRKGGLVRSVKRAKTSWVLEGDSLFFDTSRLDPKWAWHNFGRPNRKVMFGSGMMAPNPLPQREFIGASPAAERAVITIFGAWLDGLVVAATSPSGTPFFRHQQRGGNPANVGQFSRRTY